MKKIMLIADVVGWVFNRHCDEIRKRMTEYLFDVKFTWQQDPRSYDYQNFDLVYQLDPMGIPFLSPPREKTIVGLRNEFMYGHTKEGITKFYKEFFEPRCCMFHVVNRKQFKEFLEIDPSIPLLLTQHGIDTNCFAIKDKKIIDKNSPLVLGVSGNKNSAGEKGFDIIEQACQLTGCIPLITKQNLVGTHLSKEQMSTYYNKIDIYCCMSKSEGLNNCIMEAGATAVPVITTRTGAVEEMIENGKDGFIIERNVDALVEKINFFKNNREAIPDFGNKFMKTITENWSWDIRIKDFRRMFDSFFKLEK